MSNKELLNKVKQEFEERKAEINKNIHDWDYWELYMMYELCEWLETVVNEYKEYNKDLIEHIKTKDKPLSWMMRVLQNLEDDLWDSFGMNLDFEMRWEKNHTIHNA